MQEWRDVVGFEDDYEISSTGTVRSKDRVRKYYNSSRGKFYTMNLRGRVRTPSITFDGYEEVHLMKGKDINYYARVHRLVAEAFIPNPENKPFINHRDGNKRNNCVDNLEWCTAQENTRHAMLELHGNWQGKNSPTVRITCLDEDITFESLKAAAEHVSGNSSALLIAMKEQRPYKGHVFIHEHDLLSIENTSAYVDELFSKYRGRFTEVKIQCEQTHQVFKNIKELSEYLGIAYDVCYQAINQGKTIDNKLYRRITS